MINRLLKYLKILYALLNTFPYLNEYLFGEYKCYGIEDLVALINEVEHINNSWPNNDNQNV